MNQVQARLSQDHQEITALLESLAQAAEASDRDAVVGNWAELETRVIHHMDAEERYLLPLLEASHPAEVKRTLLEHARIRDLLCKLGLAVELHAVRKSDIQDLIEVLRAHSEYEDEKLYVLAGEKASVGVEHRIGATLKAAVHSALRASKPLGSGPDAGAHRTGS